MGGEEGGPRGGRGDAGRRTPLQSAGSFKKQGVDNLRLHPDPSHL